MPKIDVSRFYTSQWDDLWGFVLDNAGSVEDGNDGVSVLLASPTWQGDLPDGLNRVVRGDSEILGSLTRTQLISASDLANVKNIQSEYRLQPLVPSLASQLLILRPLSSGFPGGKDSRQPKSSGRTPIS